LHTYIPFSFFFFSLAQVSIYLLNRQRAHAVLNISETREKYLRSRFAGSL
jgi:hypothetical protein